MATALLLGDWGYHAVLVEKGPGLGGSFHLLDRTFPTDSCGLCFLEPGPVPAYCPTLECGHHPRLQVLPLSQVVQVEGEAGDFTVTVRRRPRFVREDRCNGCGRCAEVCPVERPDPYEGALWPQKAIYAPPPRAVPNAWVIDPEACTRCGACVGACPRDAVDLEMPETVETLHVGAIVASPGFEPFDPRLKAEYGFGRYRNVLSAVQFERMVSFSGSTGGNLVRPSDGRPARRIAFVQCVGSRDEKIGRPWCSSVCCMYTAKQVGLALQLAPEAEATVFFMDLRTFGKEFDAYFQRVEARERVRYRRCMISAVRETPSGDLAVTYGAEDNRLQTETFDLVVLAVGFDPPKEAAELAAALGIELNALGYPVEQPFVPLATTRPGVVVSGAFREPKDIPETVAEAAAAAGMAAGWLETLLPPPEPMGVQARQWDEEPPRVGVFLCDCQDLREGLPLEQLAEQARGLWGVAHVERVADLCRDGHLDRLVQAVERENLNRVVVGGCSPRDLGRSLLDLATKTRLSPSCLKAVNLREQCAWVHAGDQEAAGAHALEALRMAAHRLCRLPDLRRTTQPTAARRTSGNRLPAALVLGGGLAGMTTALSLARWGHPVHLVEQGEALGGLLRRIQRTPEGREVGPFLSQLVAEVEGTEGITTHLRSRLVRTEGEGGHYRSLILGPDGSETWAEHGAVIVATGGQEGETRRYLRGQDRRVLTQLELEERLAQGELGSPRLVAMIQCVGQRGEERAYCSRFCCTEAVKNALALQERFPQVQVVILYQEMRTYGFGELLYRRARQQGVLFVRYSPEAPPQVQVKGDELWVTARDLVLDQDLRLLADWVVLSTGAAPGDQAPLAEALGVALDGNGFFREEHPKMRPVDLGRPGMYVCGLAQGPRRMDEAIVQARAAAARAAAFLHGVAQVPATRVLVNEKWCSGCELCVAACPYQARAVDPATRRAYVVETLCQGCGACAVVCPNKATQQLGYEHAGILAAIDAAL